MQHHLDADNNVVPIGAAKAVDDALATDREGTGHSGSNAIHVHHFYHVLES